MNLAEILKPLAAIVRQVLDYLQLYWKKLHCLIMPIYLGVLTPIKRLRDINAEVRG